jgi:hypothetical protein
LTADGQTDFSYLQPTAPITMDVGTFGWEATPLATPATGTSFDPLVTGPSGSALVGIYTDANGVQDLVETFDQNQYQLQAELLRHGVMLGDTRRVLRALEDTGIKLDCVASDILGKSGRAMLDALVAGTTDPDVLADLAQGKLRAKIPALREALRGRFESHHALVIGTILAHLDFLDEQINGLSEAIAEQLGPTGLAGVKLRLKPRIGHGRALGAVKHSILIAYWHMFTTGETYRDLGGDYFARRDPERATKRLIAKLQALGHQVTLQPAAA